MFVGTACFSKENIGRTFSPDRTKKPHREALLMNTLPACHPALRRNKTQLRSRKSHMTLMKITIGNYPGSGLTHEYPCLVSRLIGGSLCYCPVEYSTEGATYSKFNGLQFNPTNSPQLSDSPSITRTRGGSQICTPRLSGMLHQTIRMA